MPDFVTPESGTGTPHPEAPVCENCQRIVAPKVYAVTLHANETWLQAARAYLRSDARTDGRSWMETNV